MKRSLIVSLILFSALLLGLAPAIAEQLFQDEIVPINGLAYWGTEPTGPDNQGVTLQPFAAQNPDLAAWKATQRQNEQFLDPAGLPVNIQVSQSGTFTYASNPLNGFSEVMLAIDPTNPQHLLGSSKFFYNPAAYAFYTGVFESYDDGLTWSQLQPTGVETYTLTSDPVNTFDELGNGYFTLLTRSPTGLDMLIKPAGGSWEAPVVVDRTTVTDKQWIIADQDPQNISPYAGNVYMSWTDFSTQRAIDFSRSTDRNQTWSPPIVIAPGSSVQGSIPAISPDGTIHVAYGRGVATPGSATLEFVTSTDGGLTFSSPAVAATITPIPYYLPNSTFRNTSLPAFAVSPVNGNLYLAWPDYRNGDADIYFSFSDDAGSTWSTPERVNSDPLNNGIDQFQPQIAVAPNGRVSLMWFDRRLDCPDLPWITIANVGRSNYCIDTFMANSFDAGSSWTDDFRVSEQSWDWSLNIAIASNGAGFIGDYQGLASSNEYDFPFWNATANLGNNANNHQQVFVARVPVNKDPTNSAEIFMPTLLSD